MRGVFGMGDHLALFANIQRSQTRNLNKAGILLPRAGV